MNTESHWGSKLILDILNSYGIEDPKLEFRTASNLSIEIVIDRFQNPKLYPQWWESVLELDFIKEIESKTDYLYNSHFYRLMDEQLLVIHLGHKNWNTEGDFIYLDSALKNEDVITIGDNLDDIFDLGWPDGDFGFRKNWGVIQTNRLTEFWGDFNYPDTGVPNQINQICRDYKQRFHRPVLLNKFRKVWKLRFFRLDKNNLELVKDLLIPFLKRLGSEYNIEVISCKSIATELKFSEDFEKFEIPLLKPYSLWSEGFLIGMIDKSFDLILKIK